MINKNHISFPYIYVVAIYITRKKREVYIVTTYIQKYYPVCCSIRRQVLSEFQERTASQSLAKCIRECYVNSHLVLLIKAVVETSSITSTDM